MWALCVLAVLLTCAAGVRYAGLEGTSGGSDSKEPACNVGDLSQEDPLEKEMATHCSILAWRIPWTEELGGLQSMALQRVKHD